MSGVQTCKWEPTKVDACATNPGLAARWFGMDEAAIEAAAGRFKKGKNAGKLRGWIVYRKCREGGWCFPVGGVIRPGITYAIFCSTYDGQCETFNLPTERFIAAATRVDTCYGYDPAQARAERAAQEERWKEQAKQVASEDEQKKLLRPVVEQYYGSPHYLANFDADERLDMINETMSKPVAEICAKLTRVAENRAAREAKVAQG